MQRLPEADVVRDAEQQDDNGRRHARDDDEHLLDVGPRHGLHAAVGRVDDHRDADRQHGHRHLPAQDRRHDDGRSGQRHAERERPPHQEEEARERSRPHVEPALEILVRRVDLRAVKERHEGHRQDHHRERQAEVELDEAKAGEVRLARRADERHGAHLRRHHGQADRPPRQRSVAEKVALDLVRPFRAPQPVVDNPRDVHDDDGPIERSHAD